MAVSTPLASCLDCGLSFDVNDTGQPLTFIAGLCDRCGGDVEVDRPTIAERIEARLTPGVVAVALTIVVLIGFAIDPGHGMP